MLLIGITGSFASGKSYVLDLINDENYKTFSCDECVNNLYKDENIKAKILNLLPDLKVFDKSKLAKIIYKDKVARRKIERLIHPIVLDNIKNYKLANEKEKFIFVEVPLLFEADWQKYFNVVITTYCSEDQRLINAKSKANFDQKIYDKLNEIQIQQDEKIKKADFVINTDVKMIELRTQIINILEKLQ